MNRGRPKTEPGAFPFRQPTVEPRTASQLLQKLFDQMAADHIPLTRLAAEMGMSGVAIAHWKSGRSTPGVDKVELACEVLGYEAILVRREDDG